MALTQSDLDALDTAIASSELEVEIEGRRVRYRSTDDLMRARAHVATMLQSGSRPKRLTFRPTFTTQRES